MTESTNQVTGYKTHKCDIAAFILTQGGKLVGIERKNNKMYYIFDKTPDEADSLFIEYCNSKIKIFADHRRDLVDKAYERRNDRNRMHSDS